jgi:hypothetical protein
VVRIWKYTFMKEESETLETRTWLRGTDEFCKEWWQLKVDLSIYAPVQESRKSSPERLIENK